VREVRPRQWVHRGRVPAAGFFIDVVLCGEREAQQRVLAAWAPGAKVARLEGGLLLELTAPRLSPAAASIGTALVRLEGSLSAAPLAKDELEALCPAQGAVVLVQGGAARVHELAPAAREDPATWLDVGGFEVVKVEALDAPPGLELLAEPVQLDVRGRLGAGVPAAAPEMAKVADALHAASGRAGGGPGSRAGRLGAAAAMAAARFLEALRTVWQELVSPPEETEASTPFPSRPPPPAAPAPSRSLLDRLRGRLQRLAARLLIVSRLAHLVGRRQAEYLSRMMEMFEQGDLQDALRHAIPLGSDGARGTDATPALGMPAPRSTLRISLGESRQRYGLGVATDLAEELRRLYRSAFERLSRMRKVEEAAFVLAELLHASEEAVAFLERHGKLTLAAEIAEGRGLPPGLVVRQWFLAGDVERAILIARRTGAFADAVVRLERTSPGRASALRLRWASVLAEAGDYAGAVEVVWPLESARGLATGWLDQAIVLGGAAGARALVRKLVLEPAAFPKIRDRALELLEDESPDQVRPRAELARELYLQAPTPELATLARPVLRAVLRDQAELGSPVDARALHRLLLLAQDAALAADLPALPQTFPGSARVRPFPEVAISATADEGTLSILDAAQLPNGRLLVALGEAGARILTRDGRTVRHLDVPAHRLVVSEHGDRALVLAPRGEVQRLARLDLVAGRATDWGEARLSCHAPGYDGSLWFAASGDTLLALDTLADEPKALWRTTDVGGGVLGIARSQRECHFLVDADPIERWSLELPSLTLRSRTALPPWLRESAGESPGPIALGESGAVAIPATAPADPEGGPGAARIRIHDGRELVRDLPLRARGRPGLPALTPGWLALPFEEEGRREVVLVDLQDGTLAGRIVLEGANRVSLRTGPSVLVIADDRGRLITFDLDQGRFVRDLRL
jgi:hypothetical protein